VWFPNNLHNEARDLGRAWITDAARRWEASAVTLEALRAEYQAQLDAWIAASGKRKVSDLARYREAHITQVVPLEYRQPIVRDMLKNPAAFDRVQLWAPGGKKPGLIVFGATGYGKTRAIYNRLATLYRENGTQFYALTADELKQGVIVAAHNGEVEHEATYEYRGDHLPSLRREPSTFEGKLRAADIVFIDDLSQTKMTGYYAERLFALVEHRVARAKPLIVSVQMDGDRLAHKLAGWDEQFADTAACIVRRLRDFCQSVNFGCDPAPP
jgi:DNA replication protein DnaC